MCARVLWYTCGIHPCHPIILSSFSHHQGNYSVQIHVKPAAGTIEFMCIQVDFEVVAPSGALLGLS